jgi:hypothetical protein
MMVGVESSNAYKLPRKNEEHRHPTPQGEKN